jgi:hypothetical protein
MAQLVDYDSTSISKAAAPSPPHVQAQQERDEFMSRLQADHDRARKAMEALHAEREETGERFRLREMAIRQVIDACERVLHQEPDQAESAPEQGY